VRRDAARSAGGDAGVPRRFFAAIGFFFAAGRAVRRGFAFAGSFIVSSIFTSCLVSSRQSPGVSFGSEIGPMATRRSLATGCPTAWNILRICCVRPSRRRTSNQLLPSSSLRPVERPVVFVREISHGSVRLPSMVMPRCSLSMIRSSGTPRTLT
jgi:hypothetical protein